MAVHGPAADARAPLARTASLPATLDRATPTVLRAYGRGWRVATRAVLGVGVAVLTTLSVLLLPVMAGVMIVGGLMFRHDLAEFVRSSVETIEDESRILGLGGLALASSMGWHLVLGRAGVAVVLVDVLGGLPLLLRSGKRRPALVDAARGTGHHSVPAGRHDGRDLRDLVGDVADPDDTHGATMVRPRQALDDALGHLSDAELRHAWNASSRALLMVDDPATRLRIVAARARYLEAMEQRDPERFAAWARGTLGAEGPPDDLPDLDGRQ